MLPHRHQVDYARRKGNVPYPCFYCMNYVQFDGEIRNEHNNIESFGTEANVPNTCMAGLTCPTGIDDCKGIQILELPQFYNRWYPSPLFERFTRDYYMEMLTDIKCGEPITRSMLVGRAHKGYHTREQRINEMLEEGVITESLNIKNEPTYSLTAYGNAIAEAICNMLNEYLIVKERGELMESEVHKTIFEWIRSHPNSTAGQIYQAFGDDGEIATSLEDLMDADYVEPLFDDSYSEIRMNVTQRGIDTWKMITERRQSIVQDATIHLQQQEPQCRWSVKYVTRG